MVKMSASEIVYFALVWADENVEAMMTACRESDPELVKTLADNLRQMRAYRIKRFGKPANPMADAKLVDAVTFRWPPR